MNNHKAYTVFLSTTLLLVFLLSFGVYASAPQFIMTEEQAKDAFEYALEYVENDVAYLYGGRLSVDDYLQALADGKKPGEDIGVDSSAVVINAYRSVLPEIRFFADQTQQRSFLEVSSSALYHWNTKRIEKDDVVPGDLVFFQNSQGSIIGVGLISHFEGQVAHFVVASANAGRVVLTNALMDGEYWQNSFAGFGRLQYTVPQ